MMDYVNVEVDQSAEYLKYEDLPASIENPPYQYTEDEFLEMTGTLPGRGELERLNCYDAGRAGHLQCGMCVVHELPRAVCGCLAPWDTRASLPVTRVTISPRDNHLVCIEVEKIIGLELLELSSLRDRLNELRASFAEMGKPFLHDIRNTMIRHLLQLSHLGVLRRHGPQGTWEYQDPGEGQDRLRPKAVQCSVGSEREGQEEALSGAEEWTSADDRDIEEELKECVRLERKRADSAEGKIEKIAEWFREQRHDGIIPSSLEDRVLQLEYRIEDER